MAFNSALGTIDLSRILSQRSFSPAIRTPTTEDEYESDDSNSFDDPDDAYLGLYTSLSAIRKGTTKYLNYTTDYVWDWTCEEAFRESYQNWRDGILRSANLNLSQFKTTYAEKKRVILVEVREPNTDELLGFIHFKYDKDGLAVGGLKMANFNASLRYNALGTGATSKANDPGQTGQHGEGMKLSALVYRRNNYNFRIESSGFKWNFIFKRGELACRLSRVGDKSLAEMKKEAEVKGPSRVPVSHPWEDVCVVIGARGPAHTISGRKVPGARVHVDDFKKWLKVTLDINPPTKLIRTTEGDLIRDPTYQSQMYLRGLLLPSGGMSGKKYAYGYNFIDGSTTRDRDSLAGSGEESMRIASIWAAAIRADDSEDSDIVTEYTSLLLNSLNSKGDATLSYEQNCLSEDIAKRVWGKMLKMNKDTQGRQAFYYSALEGKDDVQIIEQSFRMNPVPLDQEMWKMLDKYHLCRTPADELLHRFKFAKIVPVPKNNFAAHVSRMLGSLLQSTKDMDGMKFTFVDGEHLQIDAGFFADTWRIHDKWLNYEGAHEHTFCETLALEADNLFSCDHAVLQLWDILLCQLIGTGQHARIAADQGWLKSMARGRLAQIPRSVKCEITNKKGGLRVTWKSTDSYQHKDKEVKVVLHVETCTEVRTQNFLMNLSDDQNQCDCPSQLSQAVSDGVVFLNLKLDQKYLPSVSRNIEGAIIALQPGPVRPRTENLIITTESTTDSAPTTELSNSGGENVAEASNDKNDKNDTNDSDRSDDSDDSDTLHQLSLRSSSPHSTSDTTHNISSVSPGLQSNSARATPLTIHPRNVTLTPKVPMKITVVPSQDIFILGPKIEHQSLDWGGSFPGSHDFHRTSNTPNEEVYILKPKVQLLNDNGKRLRDPEEEPRAIHSKSKQPRCEDAEDDSADEGAPSLMPQRQRFFD